MKNYSALAASRNMFDIEVTRESDIMCNDILLHVCILESSYVLYVCKIENWYVHFGNGRHD